MADSATLEAVNIDQDAGDFTYPEDYEHDAGYGLTSETIDYISDIKKEADWIREFRHKALKVFNDKPMPTHWASKDLENIVFDNIRVLPLKRAKANPQLGRGSRRREGDFRASRNPRERA